MKAQQIIESPDTVYLPSGYTLSYDCGDYSFGFVGANPDVYDDTTHPICIISRSNEKHWEMAKYVRQCLKGVPLSKHLLTYGGSAKDVINQVKNSSFGEFYRTDLFPAGRVWEENEVISFWGTREQVQPFIGMLKKAFLELLSLDISGFDFDYSGRTISAYRDALAKAHVTPQDLTPQEKGAVQQFRGTPTQAEPKGLGAWEKAARVQNVPFKRLGDSVNKAQQIIDLLETEINDATYADAVERGDMAEARQMVNAAAYKAGYTTPGTHITDSEFTSFDPAKFGKHDFGFFGKGIYFGAGHWNTANAKKRAIWYPSGLEGKYTHHVYLKLGKNLRQFAGEQHVGQGIGKYDSMSIRDPHTGTDSEYVVRYPSQVKSADPVTYNSAGLVPLSKRFNSQSDDIRESSFSVQVSLGKTAFSTKTDDVNRDDAAARSEHTSPHTLESSDGRIHGETGLPLNSDGTVTLYHGTTRENASIIRKTGILKSAGEPDVYLTTAKEGTGYGDGTSVAVRIDPHRLILDDEFPNGRKDFRVAGKSVRVAFDGSP